MIGARFGKLVVIERSGVDGHHRAVWRCICDCGREARIAGYKLRQAHTKSCGCIKGLASVTHGMSGTPTHNSWCAMKQRCFYPKSRHYAAYGGRGITVCERWRLFENFLADMGERPVGATLDRIDNDGNYEPGNCRWAPGCDQARNRRSTILVVRGGVAKCVKDWCDELGLNVDRVYGRIRRGEAPSEALR